MPAMSSTNESAAYKLLLQPITAAVHAYCACNQSANVLHSATANHKSPFMIRISGENPRVYICSGTKVLVVVAL